MKSSVIAVMLAVLCACGPDVPDPTPQPPPPAPPPPTISSDFTGRWQGTSVVCAPGQGCVTNSGLSLVLAASAQRLTASGFCPDGSGVMTVNGQSGRSVTWNGSVVCTYASNLCATTRNEYVHATMSLDASNKLTIVAYANLSGCGYAFATTTTFTGTK